MRIKNGGPAFPNCHYNMKGGYDIIGGMTLRDYFAAKAMQGIIEKIGCGSPENISRISYHMADAMLAERVKEKCDE